MLGNASELVEDLVSTKSYRGAPRDGSAWIEDCSKAVFFSVEPSYGVVSFCSPIRWSADDDRNDCRLGPFSGQSRRKSQGINVCLWHFSDIPLAPTNVRYRG